MYRARHICTSREPEPTTATEDKQTLPTRRENRTTTAKKNLKYLINPNSHL